jgi:hypothetical protein
MKKILISFASSPKWYRAQNTLVQSAKKFGFNGVISYTDQNTKWDFVNRYKDITKDSRGFGFWQWKSIILLDAMKQVQDGDIVAYIDSGNTIVSNLDYIFNKCIENDIVLFENRDGNYERTTHKNKNWTKRDTFQLMECTDRKYYEAPQIDASYQFYKKGEKALTFLNDYRKYSDNENIISDLPNITGPESSEFIDHRHDQSIASLLAVKYNVELLPEPSEWGNYLVDRPYKQLFWHHRGVF